MEMKATVIRSKLFSGKGEAFQQDKLCIQYSLYEQLFDNCSALMSVAKLFEITSQYHGSLSIASGTIPGTVFGEQKKECNYIVHPDKLGGI